VGNFSSDSEGKVKRRWSLASWRLLAQTNLCSHTDGPWMRPLDNRHCWNLWGRCWGIDLNAIMSISAQYPQQLKIKLEERAIKKL